MTIASTSSGRLENHDAAAAALAANRPALVWRRLIADTETPVGAAVKLIEPGRGDFLLESVEGGEVRGRYSLLGLDPDLVFRATGHASSEVTDVRWRDRLAEALALEQNLERDERIDGQRAVAVDPAVAGTSRDDDLRESSFAQDALAQPFEAGRRQLQEDRHDSASVVVGRRARLPGNYLLGWLGLRGLRAALLLEDPDPLEEDLVGLGVCEAG